MGIELTLVTTVSPGFGLMGLGWMGVITNMGTLGEGQSCRGQWGTWVWKLS